MSNSVNTISAHIKTLEDLIPLSKWAEPAIRIVREHMAKDPGHDESHLVRVARDAIWFSEGYYNDCVIPAAILHDLVNVPKSSPDRAKASLMSADKAIELLDDGRKWNHPTHHIDIHHAIEAHSFSANVKCRSLAAMAVQDADRIEALGHIGWVRLFAVSGSMGRPLLHPTDPLAERRDLDELAWGLDHFAIKLCKLHTTMKTEIGKRIANLRTYTMMGHLAHLISELEGTSGDGYAEFEINERVQRFVGLNPPPH